MFKSNILHTVGSIAFTLYKQISKPKTPYRPMVTRNTFKIRNFKNKVNIRTLHESHVALVVTSQRKGINTIPRSAHQLSRSHSLSLSLSLSLFRPLQNALALPLAPAHASQSNSSNKRGMRAQRVEKT